MKNRTAPGHDQCSQHNLGNASTSAALQPSILPQPENFSDHSPRQQQQQRDPHTLSRLSLSVLLMAAPLFGVIFTAHSYPITAAHFQQVDQTHWVLDVCSLVRQQYWDLKEVCLFLTAPDVLDPSLALGLYVKCGASEWLYRGCVHSGHPSEVMPLQWPAQEGGFVVPPAPGFIQLGVSVEPLAELSAKEGSRLGDKMQFARRVGQDLHNFLASFATQAAGDAILIPTNALDRWMQRFETKFRLDPDFLTRQADKD